jgi:hypothetical protein
MLSALSPSSRYVVRALGAALAVAAVLAPSAPAAWTVAPGTVPSNTSALAGVTCLTSSACLLVGFQSGVGNDALVADYNGSAFSALTAASTTSELYDTTCGPSLCFAVGTDYSGTPSPHAESYNGSSWSTMSMVAPTGSTFAVALGIGCPTASDCFAVGWYQNSGDLPFAEHWNGTSWSQQSLTLPANTIAAKLLDISCTSASACTAVGYFEATGQPRRTLVMVWNGTSWTPQTSANPSGAAGAQLHGVECGSSSQCTAVGEYLDGSSVQHALAEGWNGTSWSVQSVPDPASGSNPTLNDVSCSSASACSGVGQYTSTTPSTEPLAARWNGTTWSLQSVPKATGVSDATLYGVSCPSSCMAVGASTYDGSTAGITGQRPAVDLGP